MELVHSAPVKVPPPRIMFSARMIEVTHTGLAVYPDIDTQHVTELARNLGYEWASGAAQPGPDDTVLIFEGREDCLVEKVAVAVAKAKAAVVAVADIAYLAGREDDICRFADVVSVLPRVDLHCTGRISEPLGPVPAAARARLWVVR